MYKEFKVLFSVLITPIIVWFVIALIAYLPSDLTYKVCLGLPPVIGFTVVISIILMIVVGMIVDDNTY